MHTFGSHVVSLVIQLQWCHNFNMLDLVEIDNNKTSGRVSFCGWNDSKDGMRIHIVDLFGAARRTERIAFSVLC